MDLNSETVTLIAACTAAVTSIIGLALSLVANRATEFRASHRKTLEPIIYELSDSTYEVIAVCVKMSKVKSEESISRHFELAKSARDRLEALRRKARYVLYGLDETLQLMAGSPVYFTHLRSNNALLSEYIHSLTDLRISVDEIVRKSYARGRPPTKFERKSILSKTNECKRIFGSGEQVAASSIC